MNPTHHVPRLPAALLRRLLPHAERDAVLSEVAAEYGGRAGSSGRRAARLWLWRQVLASAPELARLGWWRGWGGHAPRADRWNPGGAVLEGWAKDVRYTLRRLRRRPLYATLTVLTLSLGVAGTAAVYGIVKRVLLDPLPVAAEEEVVAFWMEGAWSLAEFAYLRPEMEGFGSVAAYRRVDVPLTAGDGPARLVQGLTGTAELFDVLGVRPALGRGFEAGDDVQGTEPVVVLSHGLWRELGGDPSILGRSIELAGVPYTVVGVMPAGFWFPDPTARAWLSLKVNPEDYSGNYGLLARLPPGVSIAGMAGPLEGVTRLLGERFTYPEAWDMTRNPELTPVRDWVVGSARPALLALLAAMAAILAIACVNVAALMLGQVDSRGPELAVRRALGAGLPRLLRQLAVESLVIGALAGLAGAGLAVAVFRFLVGALPLGALAETAAVDWPLFWAAIGVSLAASTAIALVPGASLVRGNLQAGLTRTRTMGVAGRGGRLESGLVVAQVALVLLLASGAALLIRSVANLRAIDPGVRMERVAVVDAVMPVTTPAAQRPQVVRELVEVVAGLPGVASAAATQRLPLRGSSDNWGITVESRPELESTTTAFRVVTPGYLETMGVALRSGRFLLETDRLQAGEGVVVINQALADRYFPGVNPLGQRIAFMEGRWDRVVGVVDNVAEAGLTTGPEPARYMLYEHVPWLLSGQTLVFRLAGGGDPAPALDAARRAIQAASPGVAVRELTTMARVFDQAVGPARQVMAMLTLLGALALVLGVVGVYGVVSHFVTRRARDWGVRIALGMQPALVVRQVLGQGGALVGLGILVGTAGFLLLARLLASFLYGVGPADPVSLAGAAAVLLAAGLVAALVPARRAGRIDPASVLKES
jgi:putative ABC transport system permease protein